ncbi:MAG: hypothetical protein IK102_06930 [Treponema sp.]|nr:hypothetical protein [Treponema sp.]
MKKTFVIIYSVFISLVLVFAISFFGVNIYNEHTHGDLRTQVRFEKMSTSIINASKKSNLSSDELNRQINNAIGDTKDFSFIQIKSNGNAVYSYPSDLSEELKINSSKLVLNYSKRNAETGLIIEAGMYTIRPAVIYRYAKITFFIILIAALITIIVIMIQNNKAPQKKVRKVRKVVQAQAEEYDEEEVGDYVTDQDIEVQESEEDVEDDSIEVEEEVEEPAVQEEAVEKEPVELPSHEVEPVELEGVPDEKGLFSPDTGLGWESYLNTRLENELNRATASELDLALFIIKLSGITRKDELMKKICDYLIMEFQFKDLLFEYKEDSVCALKISMNIDDAIAFAEKIEAEIKKLSQDNKPKVFIGISTRGIRMVSAERLLREADEAIVHAQEDESCPVVGFRADAVKYRKFIEQS